MCMIEAAKLVRKRNAIKSYFLMIAEVKSLRRCEKAYTGCCDTSKYHIYLVVNGKDNS